MNSYGSLLGNLFKQGCQVYPYQSLLREEALMRFCAQQTQKQIRCKKSILAKDLPDEMMGLFLAENNS